MEPALTGMKLKVTVLFLVTIQLRTDVTEAMQITSSGPQTIRKPEWDTVQLGCTYTPGPRDTGDLDIEWYSLSPDMTQRDTLILSYTGGQMHYYGDTSISKRLRFIADPKLGDASISISDVRLSDTATYQCKVKKAPGVEMRKVTLVVMVPPSVPKCWVEGGEEKGGPVSLRCKSSKGYTPLTYLWKRESGGAIPATATQNSESGELLISNHTDSNTGTYMCEAKNYVGKAQCKYELHAYNPTNKAGVIVGAVIGAILLLLLLLFLIWLLICCCHKRRYQKEVANEIREDAPAPESRPSSRNSSLRSVMGYRTHPGVHYSSVGNHLPSIRESQRGSVYTGGSTRSTQPPTAGDRPAPLQYDHQYGYPV
ncbi:coxsackievirus and adenovirus receptor homolog [Seriola lalandi dorsalis]|uniref:V-set and immunoglobulin domain containing 8b n=1 Tax=Seriola lalandi dorsalis TaxID=1841481 RepID=A0A3B4XQE9_SERLL|nr:coxsackievirus and adenovirus receptor homolog [Seriola lalandi dorsalis]XP_056232656.1 V-set and immunoglobulin domain-containing protein 8b [Seriola aureovittata]